jgi:hypothetical protein
VEPFRPTWRPIPSEVQRIFADMALPENRGCPRRARTTWHSQRIVARGCPRRARTTCRVLARHRGALRSNVRSPTAWPRPLMTAEKLLQSIRDQWSTPDACARVEQAMYSGLAVAGLTVYSCAQVLPEVQKIGLRHGRRDDRPRRIGGSEGKGHHGRRPCAEPRASAYNDDCQDAHAYHHVTFSWSQHLGNTLGSVVN